MAKNYEASAQNNAGSKLDADAPPPAPDTRTFEDISREITDAQRDPQRREALQQTDPHVSEKYAGTRSDQLVDLIYRAPKGKGDDVLSAGNELIARTDRSAGSQSESSMRVLTLQNALREGKSLDPNGFLSGDITDAERWQYHGEVLRRLLDMRKPGELRGEVGLNLLRVDKVEQGSQIYFDSIKHGENLPNQLFSEELRLLAADVKRFNSPQQRTEMFQAADLIMGEDLQIDRQLVADSMSGKNSSNPDQLTVQDFPNVALGVFDRVDADKDGFLSPSELKQAYSDPKIVGKEKDSIGAMQAQVGMLQNLSNDEYGEENDGITRADLTQFSNLEKRWQKFWLRSRKRESNFSSRVSSGTLIRMSIVI